MTDAFKKIFLGLGGDPKELSENNDVGDYILDLESAIKKTASDAVGDVINDYKASDTTTYSSNKIKRLIPDGKYSIPSVSVASGTTDLTIYFPDGTTRNMFLKFIAPSKPTALGLSMVIYKDGWAAPISFLGQYIALLSCEASAVAGGESATYYGIVRDANSKAFYELYVRISIDSNNDAFYYKAFEFPTT